MIMSMEAIAALLLEQAALRALENDEAGILRDAAAALTNHDLELVDPVIEANRLLGEASRVPGGYRYEGICSSQVCFPLKSGGELRLSICEADDADGTPSDMRLHVDHYDGSLPPGITGPAWKT